MKNFFRGILFFTVLILHLSLSAAYLKFVPQTVTQPDGTVFQCYASGDEFYNWLHDENGYTILQHPEDGYYYFAILSGNTLSPSNYRADLTNPAAAGLEPWINIDASEMIQIREQFMREEMKTRPEREGYPSTAVASEFDEINNIVVYIRFSNQPEYLTDTMYYHNMYNSDEPGYNSMKNYFRDVSYGELDMPSWFYPVPEGNHVISYQDENPRNYYMPYNAVTNPEGYQGNQRTQREHALLKRAVEYINDQVPESINLDDNNDGFVDNVIFVIKGEPTAWSTLLWPHRWVLYNEEAYINGKRVWDFNFQIESELDSRGNGVLCHETYHTLGAPDLYHYNSSPITAVGRWDVMESNANPPQSMGAYMKFRYGGWISEIPEITECGTYMLNPITSAENNVYKVASPNSSSEYFILEYRLREGTFESSLPGSGLLVYRIDTKLDGAGNAQGPPDEVFIFRPNGAPDKNGDLNIAHLSADVGRTVAPQLLPQISTPKGSSLKSLAIIPLH
ncbi:MAG: M6 family metalloprotease domain-containing protein [bacterium]